MRCDDDVDALKAIGPARMTGWRTIAAFAGTCERAAAVRLTQGLLMIPVPVVRMPRRFGHWYGNKMPAGNR